MDEAVRKTAAFGLPAILFVLAMAATGLTGAAAITAALAMLGPGGMIGGIVFLGITGLVADALAKYGVETFVSSIYLRRIDNGETKESLCREIGKLPASGDLKRKLREAISCTDNSDMPSSPSPSRSDSDAIRQEIRRKGLQLKEQAPTLYEQLREQSKRIEERLKDGEK